MADHAKQWAKMVGVTMLRFAGVIAAVLLIGFGYAIFGRASWNPRAIPQWFLRLSLTQLIALGVGLIAAFLMVALPCAGITNKTKREDDGYRRAAAPKPFLRQLAVLAILLLYLAGVAGAYHLSRALGHTRDWAIIHGTYSWLYVAFSLGGWLGEHRSQPLGKTWDQFRALWGM